MAQKMLDICLENGMILCSERNWHLQQLLQGKLNGITFFLRGYSNTALQQREKHDNKQSLDEDFVISGIIKVRDLDYSGYHKNRI